MSKIWWVKQDDLKPKQLEVLAHAGEGRGFILTGPPGSGKTNLLLLCLSALKRVNYKNSRAIVFTGSLRKFIQSAVNIYKLENDDVCTLSTLAREIIKEHGGDFRSLSSKSFQEQQAFWRNEFSTYLANGPDRMFDGLCIDEAQDFDATEIKIYHECSSYTAYAIDTDQSVYMRTDGTHPVFAYKDDDDFPLFTLDLHYRVGYEICKFADLLMEGRRGYSSIADRSQYSDDRRHSTVELEIASSLKQEFDKIISRLDGQINVYPGEHIGILFPKNDQLNAFIDYCSKARPDVLQLQSEDGTEFRAKLFLGTIHDSKGLEFAVCHVGGLDTLSRFDTQKTLLYTALTRARYACYLSAQGKVPPYLSSAHARYKGPAPELDTKSLFPGA